ncbi:MAG: hypothetical protein M1829_000141 [Trizodia sp. TS-e1964]|nr:MAG: hypothetical protein M1829_000141 [Trizodia sp. TS-e1964]
MTTPAATPAAAPAPHDAPIEADPNLTSDENDSTFGDDLSTFTQSVTSSIYNYPFENGRRYHAYKSGSYAMPNDDKELDRLDLTHGMLRLILDGRIHLAPIGKEPRRILDIGTGSGIWAIEMGDEYPTAEVIGTDLSPVQPSFVPPNVKFEIDDCEAPWTFPYKFDFIYGRYLAGAIRNWPALLTQITNNTAPGGWVELHDFNFQYYSEDGSLTKDHSLLQWDTVLCDGFRKFGADPCPGPKLEGYMKDAGLINITANRYKLPIGSWPKDQKLKTLGSWNMFFVLDSLEAVTIFIYTNVLGWKADEVQVLLAKARSDLKDTSIHAQFDFHVVYGQKPLETAPTKTASG